MTMQIICPSCNKTLKAPPQFSQSRARCPVCGGRIELGAADSAPKYEGPIPPRRAGQEPIDVVEFFDPPSEPIPAELASGQPSKPPWARRMFEALLDPRSIQWMLTLGGALLVLGLIIWLVSLGVFQNKYLLAALLAGGSLAVHLGGCYLTLKTRYKTAGRAATFLGCVFLSLNLWFLHAQDIITVGGYLWVAGVICSLIFAATVYVLRDPLFVYAAEAGATLTVGLLLASLGWFSDFSYVSLFLLGMAFISIHAERAFPPDNSTFDRRRFGLPLFWCGQIQLLAAAILLLGLQSLGWAAKPIAELFKDTSSLSATLISQSTLLAGGMWLAAAYLFTYSDLVVRKVGYYLYAAFASLVFAEMSLLGWNIPVEGVLVVLSATGMLVNLIRQQASLQDSRLFRAVWLLGLLVGAMPVALGVILHVRANSQIAQTLHWSMETGWGFAAAMLFTAIMSRISSFLCRQSDPKVAAAHLFFSAAALIVAAAGLLRAMDITNWATQAMLLMLIPIGYILAARFWRGSFYERPVAWAGHATTAVILFQAAVGAMTVIDQAIKPVTENSLNLMLCVVFLEAAVFYSLAALIRKQSINVYFSAAAACGAVWQCLGYFGVDPSWHGISYAVLGLGLLAASRSLGLVHVVVFHSSGVSVKKLQGRGLAVFGAANGLLTIAFLSAFLQGLSALAAQTNDFLTATAMILTTVVSGLAIGISPRGGWRRFYVCATIALAGLSLMTVHEIIQLTFWTKIEIFFVAVGALLLVSAFIARFQEDPEEPNDAATLSFWLGSFFLAGSLLVAVIYHRYFGAGPSAINEIGLVAATIFMLTAGVVGKIQAPTFFGGFSLVVYLVMVILSLAVFPQVAVGVYLAVGGGILFLVGLALSIYRDRLLQLPDRFASREGVFALMNWR